MSICLVVLVVVGAGACESEDPHREESPAPAEESRSEATEAPATSEPQPHAPSMPRVLEPEREIQFRLADFPHFDDPRTVLVTINLKGSRHERPDDFDDTLFELLERRVSSPFVLKRRSGLDPGERPWARVYFVFRKVIDRYRKRRSGPRRGRLKFEAELVTRFPRDVDDNWDGWKLKTDFHRAVHDLLAMDPEIVRAIERELPTLTAMDEEAYRDFMTRMDLRASLIGERLEPLFDEPLIGLYRGGCVAVATDEGVDVYRLPSISEPVFSLGPNARLGMRCSRAGAFVAQATTDRSVDVSFHPWSEALHEPWQTKAAFERPIDTGTLRFLASGDTLCLVGENRKIGERYARIQCYDATRGTERWHWSEPGTDLAATAIRKGVLAYAAGRHLRLVDVATGNEQMRAEIPDATGLTEGAGSCLLDDLFVFPHSLGRFMAFDMAREEALWEVTTYGGSFLYCDTAGTIYLDEVGGVLMAVNANDMSPRWRFRVADEIVDTLFHRGHLFVLMPKAIFAIDTSHGEIVWQQTLPAHASRLFRHKRRLYLVAGKAIVELTRPAH